jgi:hypothetical protein
VLRALKVTLEQQEPRDLLELVALRVPLVLLDLSVLPEQMELMARTAPKVLLDLRVLPDLLALRELDREQPVPPDLLDLRVLPGLLAQPDLLGLVLAARVQLVRKDLKDLLA